MPHITFSLTQALGQNKNTEERVLFTRWGWELDLTCRRPQNDRRTLQTSQCLLSPVEVDGTVAQWVSLLPHSSSILRSPLTSGSWMWVEFLWHKWPYTLIDLHCFIDVPCYFPRLCWCSGTPAAQVSDSQTWDEDALLQRKRERHQGI